MVRLKEPFGKGADHGRTGRRNRPGQEENEMFTRNRAMAGLVAGAVTAGMGLGTVAPMVAYAATTDEATELTSTQKGTLLTQLDNLKSKIAALDAALKKDNVTTSAGDWLDKFLTAYDTTLDGLRTDINSGDRSKAAAAQSTITKLLSDLNEGYKTDTAFKNAIGTGSETTPSESYTAWQSLVQAFSTAQQTFENIVENNDDPDTDIFTALTWSDPMKVTPHATYYKDGFGTYVNLDFSYKRTSNNNKDGYIIWTVTPELEELGFTIVTTGMLAPEASVPTLGSTPDPKGAPDIYVSEDKKTFVMAIPDSLGEGSGTNGTFSFAIHTDKTMTDGSATISDYVKAQESSGAYTHVYEPVAIAGDIEDAVSGYTKQETMGTRSEKNTFKITFNTNGGTPYPERTATDATFANYDNWAGNLPGFKDDGKGNVSNPPAKTGYSFEGWYTDANFTNKFDPFQTSLADMTLYAKYVQTLSPESANNSNASRTNNNAGNDLVHTGDANATIAAVAAVTVGAGLAVTVFRRRSK